MTKPRYATGAALRAALETRLKEIAKVEGVELQRLRRQVAFDRFLARLFPGSDTQWVFERRLRNGTPFPDSAGDQRPRLYGACGFRGAGAMYFWSIFRRPEGEISRTSFPFVSAMPWPIWTVRRMVVPGIQLTQ